MSEDAPPMREFERIKTEVNLVKQDIVRFAKGIEDLRRAYDTGVDPRTLTETRNAQRTRFLAKLDRFDELRSYLWRIKDELEQRKIRFAVTQFASEKLDTDDYREQLVAINDMSLVYSLNNNFRDRMETLKDDEEAEYQAALKSIRKRQNLLLWLYGGIGILIVLFIIARRLLGKTMAIPKGLGAGSATQALVAGRYLLEREMRRDNLGAGFEAVDLRTGRSVLFWLADKNAGLSAKQAASSARAAIWVRHPNLTAMIEVIQEDDLFFLVSELVEGRLLSELLRERKRVSLASAAEVIRQAAFALDFLSQRQLTHGSICPSNLLLGEDGRLSVLGFRIPQAPLASYSAMELGFSPPTPACDVFSLAACAYEMLTGAQAFPGPDHGEQKRMSLYAAPSLSGLPRELDEALRPALLPDPAQRYRSCAQLAQALDAVLAKRPSAAPV